jgi:hypothetical protein
MKRSSKVTLTVVASMGLVACSRHYDPCEARYFDATSCADAVRGGGYYYGGTWYPMTYRYPYPYYYDSYRSHLSRGGAVRAAPPGAYGHPGVSSPSSGGTVRGGFGSTATGHSTGA